MPLMWLKHPVIWHSSRVYDYSHFSKADRKLLEGKWHSWYSADWDYGETTVIFFCAGIGFMFLCHALLSLRAYRNHRGETSNSPGLLDRIIAIGRFSAARQYHLPVFHWYSPPIGVIVAIAAIFTFIMALMLAARPYYWPDRHMGHSPPLGTRSGWISIGIMPFMLAFGTKINWIGLFTGTSHEKLQVFHRWTAVVMYITSLVHTFPYIVNNTLVMHDMELQYRTSAWYWTGIAALVPQTYLVGLSWGIFRNRYYEVFKKLHMIAAGIFMAALFVHVDFRLTSWDYFWATAALYGLAWLTRVLRTHYNSGMGVPATIQFLTPNTIKVTIQPPSRLKWSPGQHVFVRFLGLGTAFFSSHPFTIASGSTDIEGKRSLDLIMRVHKGITRKLARAAEGEAAKTINVFVDGPYGGLRHSVCDFDKVYLIAGGSGASFTVPVLLDLVKGLGKDMACSRIEFILAVKHSEDVVWMSEVLASAHEVLGERLNIQIFVTKENSKLGEEESSSHSEKSKNGTLDTFGSSFGRPNLSSLLASANDTGRVAVVACGPESMLHDVRNATAALQRRIVTGSENRKEVYLHTENFGW